MTQFRFRQWFSNVKISNKSIRLANQRRYRRHFAAKLEQLQKTNRLKRAIAFNFKLISVHTFAQRNVLRFPKNNSRYCLWLRWEHGILECSPHPKYFMNIEHFSVVPKEIIRRPYEEGLLCVFVENLGKDHRPGRDLQMLGSNEAALRKP